MSITEFLLARIAEDEAEARKAARLGPGRWVSWNRSWDVEPYRDLVDEEPGERIARLHYDLDEHIARHDPARVLRECEAKRRMVDFIFREAVSVDGEWGDSHDAEEIRAGKCSDQGGKMAEQGLAILAAAYVDHPDYLPEWRV